MVWSWNCNALTEERLTESLRRPGNVYCFQETGRLSPDTLDRYEAICQERGLSLSYEARQGNARGGVMVVFSHRLFERHPERWAPGRVSPVEMAAVWLRYRAAPETHFIVASVYAPPVIPAAAFRASMQRLLDSPARNTILVGDFNATHPSWDRHVRPGVSAERGNRLHGMVGGGDSSRFQVYAPDKPTCHRGTPATTVDLFLSTGDCHPVEVEPILGNDHWPIRATCYLDDFPSLRDLEIRVPWRPLMPVRWDCVTDEHKAAVRKAAEWRFRRKLPHSVDCAADWFTRSVQACVKRLPRRVPGRRRTLPVSLKRYRRDALAACALMRDLPEEGVSEEYRAAVLAKVKEYCKAYKDACVSYLGDAGRTMDPAVAWKKYRRACDATHHQEVPPDVRFPEGLDVSEGGSLVDRFTRLYAVKSDVPAGALPVEPPSFPPLAEGMMDLPPVSLVELRAVLRSSPTGKAMDFEGLTVEILRLLPEVALRSLAALLTKVLEQGLPELWRRSVITPVLKDGKDPLLATSYRPVAITSLLCRLVERVVQHRLLQDLRLPPEQYGFRPHYGTEVALAHLTCAIQDAFRYEWTITVGPKKQEKKQLRTLVAALDFTDAFCHVRRERVVETFLRSTSDPSCARFLWDFLGDRKIQTRVRRAVSKPHPVASGTPQGSILGPLCWALAVQPLIERLRSVLPAPSPRPAVPRHYMNCPYPLCGMIFYADDSVMWVSGPNVRDLCEQMTTLLHTFATFAEEEGIPLSAKSTVHLFHRREPPEQEVAFLDQVQLSCGTLRLPVRRTETLVFLGVHLDMGLRWTAQAQHLQTSLQEPLRALETLRLVLNPFLLRLLYFGAIESVLLYGSALWAYELADTVWDTLERLQLRAARAVTGVMSSTRKDLVLRAAAVLPLRTRSKILATKLMERVRRLDGTAPARRRLCYPTPPGNLRSATLHGRDALPDTVRLAYRSPPLSDDDPAHVRQRPPLLPLFLPIPWRDVEFSEAVQFITGAGVTVPRFDSTAAEERWKRRCNFQLLQAQFGRHGRAHLLLTDASVRPPDEEHEQLRSGYGWRLLSRELKLLEEGAGTCGPLACSFTAECWALTAALRAVLQHPTTDRCPLLVLTDSQSVLQSLALGPCARSTAEIQRLWIYLLQVGRVREVTLAFLYSHCGFSLHDGVDELASWASSTAGTVVGALPPDQERPGYEPDEEACRLCPLLPGCSDLLPEIERDREREPVVTPYGATPPPPGWQDSARPYVSGLRAEAFSMEDADWRKEAGAPELDKPVLTLPWYVAKYLYRLRVGVDPDIGGWEKGERAPSPCPWCGVSLTRDTATPHFLRCPSLEPVRVAAGLPKEGVPVGHLWGGEEEMRRVLLYRKKSMGRLAGTN